MGVLPILQGVVVVVVTMGLWKAVMLRVVHVDDARQVFCYKEESSGRIGRGGRKLFWMGKSAISSERERDGDTGGLEAFRDDDGGHRCAPFKCGARRIEEKALKRGRMGRVYVRVVRAACCLMYSYHV